MRQAKGISVNRSRALVSIGMLLLTGALCPEQLKSSLRQISTQQAAMPAQPVTEPPGEVYKDAMHPLDVVRSSLDNWSDAELGALTVGIHKAHDACEASKPGDFTGDDLYDLIRLCALGQDWENANAAAQAYIASKLEPRRAQAYALAVNALVHINAIDLALATTREMLGRLPYDAEVAYAVRYMKVQLDQTSNPEALKLASEEHVAIVAAIKRGTPLKAVNGDAVMSVSALYDSAMELAFWQRYAGDEAAASTTVADLDQALGLIPRLNAEDTARTAAVRTRYGLLGARLPEIKPIRALEPSTAKLVIRYAAPINVLVVFPDWCGGCRNMMKPLTEFVQANRETPIHAYGLVFEDDGVIPVPIAHEAMLKELRGTSTLVVPASAAQTVGANDYPMGIVLDGQGKVRFIGVLPGDAFKGDGYVEKTILKIVALNPGLGITMNNSKRK